MKKKLKILWLKILRKNYCPYCLQELEVPEALGMAIFGFTCPKCNRAAPWAYGREAQ